MKAMTLLLANLAVDFFAFIGLAVFFDALDGAGLGPTPVTYYRIVIAVVFAVLMAVARRSERRKAQRSVTPGAA